jgi:hypothetical protein
MNITPATPKFYLNVTSLNPSEVWPLDARHNPELDERIKETYYADEDEATCGFELKDMEDLLKILKFYDGKSVKLTLGVTVTTPEFETVASLSPGWPRALHASFRALEKDDLSPSSAANRIIAIAHALTKWERNQEKK